MNKLIPQQEYYVSDISIDAALHERVKRIFIGEDSKGVLWFEPAVSQSRRPISWKFVAPIPKPVYMPWNAKTRPLGGAYLRKSDGLIFIATAFACDSMYFNTVWYGWDELLIVFDYIPDLTKEHETVPCGVLKDE